MVAAALIALIVSAGATLAVPLAVRRMIDLGFSGIEPDLIDKYFATLVGVGLILALASAARFYRVNWLGERVVADLRTRRVQASDRLEPRLLRGGAFGRGDVAAHRRHDADQGGGEHGDLSGPAQFPAVDRRHRR